ncbi:MAG TPA: prepilin-type N-terminal cleavage/methylation domain-containing protein [Phycisphaerae bacterium]|nr:prepilin-type N-terminal cleavage/methylation domain-containing protein [Phycisphaerae bacterium]HRY69674.1 prepilin-type N-terminal cleavage/methylation domain-containing protein [Phycisphaerae bacterium]HSA25129.1 prepilin-type N-terminal cleavage/methylation domain-containing protein [Phycisphaerae bacterium]
MTRTAIPTDGRSERLAFSPSSRAGMDKTAVRAMTLIEVLVAMTLLSTCVAGLMASATLATRNEQRCGQRVAAMYLAQEKLAEVEMIGAHVWMLGHPTEGTEGRNETTYDWTIDIKQQSMGELFTVQVKVEWGGPSGGEVSLETWLNDYQAKYAETETRSDQETTERR